MTVVLALDPSRHTGWAVDHPDNPGRPLSGVWDLPGSKDQYGRAGLALSQAIAETVKAHAVEMIVYERPLDPRNLGDHVDKSVNHGGKPRKDFRADFETIRLLIGIPMIIETAVEHYKSQGRKIDVQEVFVQSWRSHFTGTQKGGKEPTKARCVQLRWGFRNDNQADACGIWAFAKAHIDPQWSPVQGNGR